MLLCEADKGDKFIGISKNITCILLLLSEYEGVLYPSVLCFLMLLLCNAKFHLIFI